MPDTHSPAADPIEAEILRQTEASGPDRSICPSDVACALAPESWRSRLGDVRRVAMHLAGQGRIDILRKGRKVAPEGVRGVIRLRMAAAPGQAEERG
jgi:hypothetical protein